jgi:hypothetical protein
MTWSKDVALLKTGVVSGEDFISTTIVSIKGEIECWETNEDSENEELSCKDYTSSTTTVVGKKRVKWPPLQILKRNLGLCPRCQGFSIIGIHLELSQWLGTCS